MSNLFILIEQALGYCLLNVKSCKNVANLLTLLQDKDFENVKSKIKLAEFQPFSSVNNASLNCQDIANGNANEDLVALLTRHMSDGPSILVVSDRKLLESLKAANINNALEFNGDGAMVMHLRRIRHSIHEFLGENEQQHLMRAHIGLGHSFSRMKIKFNVNRADNMIIQSINLLDQLDKDVNTMSMRLREWFGYHYPELVKIVNDNRAYSEVVRIIGSRSGAVDDALERLEVVVGDSERAKQIISSAKTSMGYELTEEDLLQIGQLANKALSMMIQREDTAHYLASKMTQVAPNFSTLVGDIVAARLISHAGSLINLAKFPASTIQILGAEKALFRALKARTNTPKYGLIFHSSFIGRAAKQDKGRISRFLAAKISLAVRLDCFMEEPTNIFGIHLKKQVEDQLKYLETGEEPKKNYEAMEDAVKDAKRYVAEMKEARDKAAAEPSKNSEVKKRKKSMTTDLEVEAKKSKIDNEVIIETKTEEIAVVEGDSKKKKKSKKNKKLTVEEDVKPVVEINVENVDGDSKKKKRKTTEISAEEEKPIVQSNSVVEDLGGKSKKKKKAKAVAEVEVKEEVKEEVSVPETVAVKSSEKKKKNKSKK